MIKVPDNGFTIKRMKNTTYDGTNGYIDGGFVGKLTKNFKVHH